mgnify:CR=1 FL=1
MAGRLDFQSAIQAVSHEMQEVLPHDHLDVCIVHRDMHVAYEAGLHTDWGLTPAMHPVVGSPIRDLLMGVEPFLVATPLKGVQAQRHDGGAFVGFRAPDPAHAALQPQLVVVGLAMVFAVNDGIGDHVAHRRGSDVHTDSGGFRRRGRLSLGRGQGVCVRESSSHGRVDHRRQRIGAPADAGQAGLNGARSHGADRLKRGL